MDQKLTREEVERLIQLRPFLIQAINAWKRDHPEDLGKLFSKLSQDACRWILDYAEVLHTEFKQRCAQ